MGNDILEGLVEPFDIVSSVQSSNWCFLGGRESTLDLEILEEVAILNWRSVFSYQRVSAAIAFYFYF